MVNVKSEMQDYYSIMSNAQRETFNNIVNNIGETEEDNAITFSNGETYSDEFIIGTGDKIYPNLGTYLGVIESKWGFLFIILVPNFFLFVYQLYSLIVEIKYGKEEDYTEA